MVSVRSAPVLLTLGLLVTATPSVAGPRVIQGMGPEDGSVQQDQPVERSGRYGGGFIELLMTGHSAPPVDRSQGARRAPPYVAAYAPAAQPEPDYGYDPGVPPITAATRPVPGYAAPRKAVDPIYVRQEVPYAGPHAPGTVVIDTANKFLYLVEGQGQALRYGIGVGRPGFLWAGEKTISRKAEWPDWTPPVEMIKRRPDLPSHMDGGINNPLGARAMYLGSSLYRIHGTNEPDTIGTNVSSGCIRLTNDDVTDLFGRVHVGTHVIVM